MKAVGTLLCALVLLAGPANCWVKEKKPNTAFGTAAPLPYSLRGAVYGLPANATALPDFPKLQPLGYVYTYSLNVPKTVFTEGMPHVTDRVEWFAVDYEGSFWIYQPGKYRFNLTSDDGSRLYVDGKIAIDNDGVHETQSIGGSVELGAGPHQIRVSYFQGPRDFVALVLEVALPGDEFHVFDMRHFRPKEAPQANAPLVDAARPTIRRDPAFRGSASLKGYETAAYEVLRSRPLPHAFEFRSTAFAFPESEFSSKYVLAFELPGASVGATATTAGKSRVHIVLLGLVKDAAGQILEKTSQDFQAEVTDQQLAALRADTLAYAGVVSLPPGHYNVETVALDRETGRASTGAFGIENPERKGLTLSSLVLTERAEAARNNGDAEDADPLRFQARRIVPAVEANLPAGAQPSVYFVVYPNRSTAGSPRLKVEFLTGEKVIAGQTAEVPAPNASGAVPMTIAAISKPGSYQLKVTLSQGVETIERSLWYSIADR